CGKRDMQIDDDALALLKAAPWPGNVRQLGSVIERAVWIAEGSLLTVADLPVELLDLPAEAEASDNLASGGREPPSLVSGGVQTERAARRRQGPHQVLALAAVPLGPLGLHP